MKRCLPHRLTSHNSKGNSMKKRTQVKKLVWTPSKAAARHVTQNVRCFAVKQKFAPRPQQRPAPSIDLPALESPEPFNGWSAMRVREEATNKLYVEFRFPNGEGGESVVEVSNSLTTPQMCRELRGFTTALVEQRKTACQFIERVLAAPPPKFCIRASRPGWKWTSSNMERRPDAFVAANFVLPAGSAYRPCKSPNSSLGASKGTLQSWQTNVASFARSSNYLAFGFCCAAAAPLARFSGLPEMAVFNLVGESSVGKTTVVRAAMSTIAPPNAIRGWDLKSRALEEAAAQHNDLLLVLNGAEKMPERERMLSMDRIIHMLTEGESTGRSVIVQDHLPNETWKSIVLSTSNRKGSEMVAMSRGWEDQDSVRFIDIPVPGIKAGGIFDRPTEGAVRAGSSLVKELEHNMMEHYGTFLPAWITYLMASDRMPRLRHWTEIYLRKTRPTAGIEERIARKFALVYGAGKIAVEARLLPFEVGVVYRAVRAMHLRSVKFRARPSDDLRKMLAEVANQLDESDAFPEVSRGGEVVADSSIKLLGVRTTWNGRRVVGLRTEALEAWFGEASTRAFISWLKEKRVLHDGGGSRATTQLRVQLVLAGKRMEKPRFLVTGEEELERVISKFRGA
jgi:hypothetical protein